VSVTVSTASKSGSLSSWLLAQVMGASRRTVLWHLALPGALPQLASGLRLAAIYAPLGAVIGEWMGGAQGLGALMLHANGRMKIDLMFAALLVVILLALLLQRAVNQALQRALRRRGFAA
nr:ABC transporter permease subunit [Gemmobacter sp.]